MPHVSDVVLNDLHDGTLDPAVRDGVQRHLLACRACRARSDGYLLVSQRLAGLPRTAEPPASVWAGIRSRIEADRASGVGAGAGVGDETPAVGAGDETPAVGGHPVSVPESEEAPVVSGTISPAGRRGPPRWLLLAAAAVTLVVASSAATLLLVNDGRGGRNGVVAFAPLPPNADPVVRFAEVEAAYLAAAAELIAVIERERRNLPPDVAERAERALAAIDLAVRETRDALASDPHNRALVQMALGAHERRLEFLQRIARWSTES